MYCRQNIDLIIPQFKGMLLALGTPHLIPRNKWYIESLRVDSQKLSLKRHQTVIREFASVKKIV
jgi:hypothetical protein